VFTKRSIIGILLILVATCVAYLPALSGSFVWDDEEYITKPELRNISGLYRIWFEPRATGQYYPLLYSAFWLQHKLWGDSPAGYHIVNLSLHLLVVILAYAILVKLEVPGALLAAGIFALHPVHVETVAWISEQKNTLSGVFYLAAMLVYLKRDASSGKLSYFGSFVLYVLAVLSKSVTATLPGALLVILWWKHGRIEWRRDVLPLVPFFTAGLVFGLVTAYAESVWVGAGAANEGLSAIQRVLVAGRAIWFYLGKLVLPVNLAFSYPKWTIDPSDWTQWLYVLGVLALLGILWGVRQRSRAPLAALLFFIGTLFPALGFLNVFPFRYSYVADHFQYLASLGIIVLAASGISLAFDQVSKKPVIAGVYRKRRPAR
jgi:protein O-mannosyl-transferase